jgi:class 3 adenylate cyclase/tetratricopeptide (TPR) repeat protein
MVPHSYVTDPAPGPDDEHAEQRRVVTLLFADLTSSTALAEAMDPEDERALLAGFFETMAREIRRHGGTIEKYIGDAVMAVFGLPIAHEDDPLRAVRAALDMQAALHRFNDERRAVDPAAPELLMRIGINTGEVAAAGAASDGDDFLVTGDAVNVASRLQALATPSAVFVGPRTYRSTSGAVEYRALPPANLRGKSRPVKIYQATALVAGGPAPVPRPRGIEGMRASLVGRDAELELLRAVMLRVLRERRPHLVTLLGVPGIGKTRLAHEFLVHATERTLTPSAGAIEGRAAEDTMRDEDALQSVDERAQRRRDAILVATPSLPPVVLEGRCPPYGESITYWPLAEMLRAYCDIPPHRPSEAARARLLACMHSLLADAGRGDDPERIAIYLGQTIGIETAERRRALLPEDSQRVQEGRLRAWRIFFEAVAARSGLLALVEDIHWADESLLDLLEYVAANASGVPLLLICTARPELMERRPEWGGGKRNELMIALEALDGGDMRRLIAELVPGAGVPESLRHSILAKADGNPFYLEEIVHMLVDRGILICAEPDDTGWRVAPEYEGSGEINDPAIPDTVQGVLLARLDLLSARERDVLQHAAVIGRFFWGSALLSLAPHLADGPLLAVDPLGVLLAALQEKGLIQPSEGVRVGLAPADETIYTFNHALIREIVYATIARTRRAHEHERVAEWIEAQAAGHEEDLADSLAQHYLHYYLQANLARARNSERRLSVRAKVLRYLALAGDQALARHAAVKAESCFGDAIALLEEEADADDLALLADCYRKRGEARWMSLRGDDAWADYTAALRCWQQGHTPSSADTDVGEPADEAATRTTSAEGPRPAAANASGASGSELVADWQWTSSGPSAFRLPPLATREDALKGMRLYRMLVQLPTRSPSYFRQAPNHETLREYLEQGLRLAQDAGACDTLEYAALLAATAFFWWSWPERRGERELLDALRSAREAVRISESLDDPRGASEALDALGNILAITTDLRGYLDSQARRLQWAQRIEDPRELVDIHGEVSMARTLVGDYALAIEHLRTARAVADAADTDPLRMHVLRALVLTHFEWDHWSDALAAGTDLLAASAHVEVRYSHTHLWALLALAVIHTRTGQREAAEALVRRVSELPTGPSPLYLEMMRGRVALARGAIREARQIWLAAADARSGRQALAALLAELAELGARSGDVRLYGRFGAQAIELGWRSGARKSLAQALRARGIVAAGEGRWDDALTDLQNALARQRELGTAWEEARTRYAVAGLFRRRGGEGDAELAQNELMRALELFERLRAVRDIARSRSALAGAEVRLP